MNHALDSGTATSPVFVEEDERLGLPSAVHAVHKRVVLVVRQWWRDLRMDESTAYLSMAIDHADLERRIRALDERDRRDRIPTF